MICRMFSLAYARSFLIAGAHRRDLILLRGVTPWSRLDKETAKADTVTLVAGLWPGLVSNLSLFARIPKNFMPLILIRLIPI